MAGITAASSRERMASLLDSVELATDIPSRLVHLRNLKEELLHSDTILLSEFLSGVLNLKAVQFRPVRKIRRREELENKERTDLNPKNLAAMMELLSVSHYTVLLQMKCLCKFR